MTQSFEQRIGELVARTADRLSGEPGRFPSLPCWTAVQRTGTALWLDTGDLDEAEELWTAEFSGLTTNNSSLNTEVQKGIYDDLIAEVGAALPDSLGEREAIREVAFVMNAVHGLQLARRFGCRVSVELHTDVAHDIDGAVRYARRFRDISPDRFIIQVPMTPAGFLITRRLSDEGAPVNFTVGLSARQNFLATVLARPAFVNVFVQRITAFIANNELGEGLTTAVAAARASQLAVREANRLLDLDVRQIMASMRINRLVELLAGADVLTINPAVVRDYPGWDERPQDIASHIEEEIDMDLRPSVDLKAVGLPALWEVPDRFKAAALILARKDPAQLTPERVRDQMTGAGFPGSLPDWSDSDLATVRGDGKYPVLAHWQDRLASGEIGLDALMNLSVFMAFVADQEAMDARISGLMK